MTDFQTAKYSFLKKSHQKNILPIILVMILLLFHDTLAFDMMRNKYLVNYIMFFCCFLFYIKSLIIKPKIKIRKIQLLILTILVILIFITMLVNQSFSGGYIYILMLLVIAFMVSQMITFNEFVEASIRCIFFLAVYSLICYALRPVIFKFRYLIPHFYNSANLPYFHLGASVIVDLPLYNRLFGIFRECGVYQIFLNIAIILELFIRKGNKRPVYIIIFYITLLLTYSTAGYIAGLMIFIVYMFLSNIKKTKREKRTFIVLIVFAILAMFLAYSFSEVFSQSFNNTWKKFTNKESSYLGRTTSFVVELNLWKERPLFGYGITEGMSKAKQIGKQELGFFMFNTSTITGLMLTMGIFFAGIISIMILIFVWKANTSFVGKLVIYAALILMLTSQLMIYNAYFYAIVFFAIMPTQDNIKYNEAIELISSEKVN